MKRYGEKFTMTDSLMDTIASYMNDEIRESLHNEMSPCSAEEFLAAYIYVEPEFEDLLKNEFSITDVESALDSTNPETLANQIRESVTWDWEICKRLCSLAGLEEEFAAADGDTFESVVYAATDVLGVAI